MSEQGDNEEILRPCPLYATTPLKFLGMDINSVVGIMIFSTFVRPYAGAIAGMVFGYFVVFLLNKFSSGQPSGYLFFRFSNWACSPAVRLKVPLLSDSIAHVWRLSKSLPPSTYIGKYHR